MPSSHAAISRSHDARCYVLAGTCARLGRRHCAHAGSVASRERGRAESSYRLFRGRGRSAGLRGVRASRRPVESHRSAQKHRAGKTRRVVQHKCAGRHHAGAKSEQIRSRAIVLGGGRSVDPRANAVHRGAQNFSRPDVPRAILEPTVPALGKFERPTHADVGESARKVVGEIDQVVLVGTASVEQDDERRARSAFRGPAPDNDRFHARLFAALAEDIRRTEHTGMSKQHVVTGSDPAPRYMLLPATPGAFDHRRRLEQYEEISFSREFRYARVRSGRRARRLLYRDRCAVNGDRADGPRGGRRRNVHSGWDVRTVLADIDIGTLVIQEGAVRLVGSPDAYCEPSYPAIADRDVTFALIEACEQLGVAYTVGLTASTDSFFAGQDNEMPVPSRCPPKCRSSRRCAATALRRSRWKRPRSSLSAGSSSAGAAAFARSNRIARPANAAPRLKPSKTRRMLQSRGRNSQRLDALRAAGTSVISARLC